MLQWMLDFAAFCLLIFINSWWVLCFHIMLLFHQRIRSSEVSVGHCYNLIETSTRRIFNVETASRKRASVYEVGETPFFHANMYLHLQINQVSYTKNPVMQLFDYNYRISTCQVIPNHRIDTYKHTHTHTQLHSNNCNQIFESWVIACQDIVKNSINWIFLIPMTKTSSGF